MGVGRTAPRPPARTLLEAKIRERSLTFEEFTEYAETVARDLPGAGTLSLRHLQRLTAATADPDRVRPATRRLLEAIFNIPTADLVRPLSAQNSTDPDTDWQRDSAELNRLIDTAHRVDRSAIRLFADQIDNIRRMDRRFGAATLLGALRMHIQHIEELMNHGSGGQPCRALAAVLTDAHTLAGWQSLDRGKIRAAWGHYGRAGDAARAAESPALLAHALAEQAVVLADIGRSTEAVQMSAHARTLGHDTPPLLRAWLAAAHGEALAADHQQDASLDAFDRAHALLPASAGRLDDGPYLALDIAHLTRWRGHALARFGHPDAVAVLTSALHQHDAEFTRAEAGLRTDLVFAHLALREHDAARHDLATAREVAAAVGSARQRRRIGRAAAEIAA